MEGCRNNTPKVLSVGCCEQPVLFHKVTIPASVGDETTDPPLPGKYRNVLLVYEASGNAYLYSSDGMPTLIFDKDDIRRLEEMIREEEATRKEEDEKLAAAVEDEAKARKDADDALDDAILDETDARIEADEDIWTEIETIEAASDVVDIVGTYAELQQYDTSHLNDNDIIKVLQDETHDGAITYWRWNKHDQEFSYVGEQGPYYTQDQVDNLLDDKQDTLTAGDNIQINDNVISATDTTYTAGNGLLLSNDEFSVDTSVIAEKSDIPTVNDATLTITQSGSTIGTFTANSSTDTTINIAAASYSAGTGIDITNDMISVDNTVAMVSDLPTKTSDLTNDGSDGTSTYVEADELATVATTGSYTDLTNTPTIPTVNDATLTIQKNGTTVQTFTANQASNATANITVPVNTSDLTNDSGFITSADLPTKTSDLTNDGSDGTSTYVEADELATVATSGSYNDLSNKPTIPAAQVNSDWNATSGVAEILNKPNLATVATSGSYTDLTNTPSIPAAQVNSDWNASSGVAEILNKPNLAAVATSGAYSDLTGTPTIPTVNDATLTVTQNGTTAGTFTANASSNTTIALTDTTYSDFTGTDGQTAGTAGLVPAPATTDAGKFLKADGTWDVVADAWAGSKVYYGTISGYSSQLKTVTVQNDFIEAVGNVMVLYCSSQNIFESSGSTAYRMRINGASTTDWVLPSSYQDGRYQVGDTIILACVSVANNSATWNIVDMNIASTDFYGEVKLGSDYTSQDSGTVPTNAQLYDVYTIANGKKGAVTYYATSDNTQGFPTYYTYLYSDPARTTVVDPDTIFDVFENGNTVLIEYESTQTGSSAYKMTLAIESVARVGEDGYRMNASEISVAAGSYNQVETQFMATWNGQDTFSGRWVLVRNAMPVVNDATLTITQNGVSVGTFTANASSNVTVALADTIYTPNNISSADWSALWQ